MLGRLRLVLLLLLLLLVNRLREQGALAYVRMSCDRGGDRAHCDARRLGVWLGLELWLLGVKRRGCYCVSAPLLLAAG